MFKLGADYDVNQLLADLFAFFVKIIEFLTGDTDAFKDNNPFENVIG